jgi:predicted PurR-regulated permease PerM
MKNPKLLKAAAILLAIFLTGFILKFGKPFLAPLAFASLLAMLVLPIALWLEKKGVNKTIATLLSVLVFVAFIAGVLALVGFQAADLSKNAGQIKQQAKEKYHQAQQFVSEKLGVSKKKQQEMIKKQQESSQGKGGLATAIVAGIGGFIATVLIIFVYIFLLIYFRGHLKRFIIRIVPDDQADNARQIIEKSTKVTRKYLTGLSLMIVGLWIMYGIGFSIAGVKSAIFFAILCGVLEIVPFVGNLVGTGLTVVMSLAQGGGGNVVIGILITYGIVQFIQSYILEPLVVGTEVNINPLFTIVGLIAGEFVWGIPGMILAIPVLGVAKIVCDHIDPLKPYGQLIGEDKKEDRGVKKKMKGFAKKMINKVKGR